jgi:hypothetical protein
MSDILAAKDEEQQQALEERDSKLKIMSQKEEMLKASYSEKVNTVYCRTLYNLYNLYNYKTHKKIKVLL